jgi:hypothetical protein
MINLEKKFLLNYLRYNFFSQLSLKNLKIVKNNFVCLFSSSLFLVISKEIKEKKVRKIKSTLF